RRIGALAGEKQGTEFGEIVFPDQCAFGIFLLDRSEGGRRGEQRHYVMLRNYPPERAGVGRADRLAFIEDGSATMKQRRIDNVGVPTHAANVGPRPQDSGGRNAIK